MFVSKFPLLDSHLKESDSYLNNLFSRMEIIIKSNSFSILQRLLKIVTRTGNENVTFLNNHRNSTMMNQSMSHMPVYNQSVQLRLSMVKFECIDGSCNKWVGFRDMFDEIVDNILI